MSLAFPTAARAAGSTLFADPLDGSGDPSAWRRTPGAGDYVAAADGRRALRYQRGTTWNSATQPWVGDESWSSCRITVDILPEKMWAGVDFCVADDGKSACNLTLFHTADDQLAFEFAGIWGEACGWKLHPIGQHRPPHRAGEWVRLRVEVGPAAANVYAGDDPDPVASFRDLPRTRGGVRLMTYAGSALFRNLRVTTLPAESAQPRLADPWAIARGPDVLRTWQVTPLHEVGWSAETIPAGVTDDSVAWQPAPVDARGAVQLTAHFAPNHAAGAAFARTTLDAPAAGTRTLKLTYTDHFTLWCNGAKVFAGPPRQWFHPEREKHGNSRLIPDQYEIVVPVRTGANALLVRTETTEPFGWGFWMRVAGPAERNALP